MICIQSDRESRRIRREMTPRAASGGRSQRMVQAMATPFPLLTAIALELQGTGEIDDMTSLRSARRLLEEAYLAVDSSPIPVH